MHVVKNIYVDKQAMMKEIVIEMEKMMMMVITFVIVIKMMSL